MTNKEEDVISFDFQEFKLADLRKILPQTYRSKYADLCNQIVERLNSLPSDQSFFFSPVNREMTELQIRNLANSVNIYLKRDNRDWRILWAAKQKAFVLEPHNWKNVKKRQSSGPALDQKPTNEFTQPSSERMNQLLSLMQKAFGLTLRQLQEHGDQQLTDFKRAMIYVGKTGLGLSQAEMGRTLRLASATTSLYCTEAMKSELAKEKVEILKLELNRG
jgi:hypothetical protein